MSRLIDTLPEPTVVLEKKVIVLSRSRVGTFSLYSALKMLGYKPYHMYEVITSGSLQMQLFSEALNCKYRGAGKPYGKAEFDKWLAAYDAIVEIPQFFLEEFIAFYPDAKFILTERSLQSWQKSMENAAGPLMKACRTFPLTAVARLDSFIADFCSLHHVLEDVCYHGKHIEGGSEDAKRDTVEGNAKAKALAPKDRLLVAKLEDGFGWEQICPFLGHDIPEMPYPQGNAPAEFKKMADEILAPRIRKAGLIAVSFILVPVVSIGVWYYMRYS
ncbi:hypothetical protein F5Y15DRAFT_26843 [Xylariaceae sp. FL0016]|nr:hypothetical protein F5Y15DRAFT_26843 [Xylariaceae sp. FL0016]